MSRLPKLRGASKLQIPSSAMGWPCGKMAMGLPLGWMISRF